MLVLSPITMTSFVGMICVSSGRVLHWPWESFLKYEADAPQAADNTEAGHSAAEGFTSQRNKEFWNQTN